MARISRRPAGRMILAVSLFSFFLGVSGSGPVSRHPDRPGFLLRPVSNLEPGRPSGGRDAANPGLGLGETVTQRPGVGVSCQQVELADRETALRTIRQFPHHVDPAPAPILDRPRRCVTAARSVSCWPDAVRLTMWASLGDTSRQGRECPSTGGHVHAPVSAPHPCRDAADTQDSRPAGLRPVSEQTRRRDLPPSFWSGARFRRVPRFLCAPWTMLVGSRPRAAAPRTLPRVRLLIAADPSTSRNAWTEHPLSSTAYHDAWSREGFVRSNPRVLDESPRLG